MRHAVLVGDGSEVTRIVCSASCGTSACRQQLQQAVAASQLCKMHQLACAEWFCWPSAKHRQEDRTRLSDLPKMNVRASWVLPMGEGVVMTVWIVQWAAFVDVAHWSNSFHFLGIGLPTVPWLLTDTCDMHAS